MSGTISTGIISSKVDSLRNDVHRLESKTDAVMEQMNGVNQSVTHLSAELTSLNQRFQQMIQDRARAEALQQASTELIRVRQEIEKNFGNYNVARETMLGILQATDLALVKQTTISRVTEELMISTPNYWLAPCLVAIAAWIADDRDLANRAITEAVRRNEERTALTMALICRRNGRTQACYEWLSLYFSKLNAGNFTEGGYTFVDAYINGVFGPDEKHMCDDYINDWLNQIRGNDSEFEKTQERVWREYFTRFQIPTGERYPTLSSNSREFPSIDAYAGRILSANAIGQYFKEINEAYVDMDALKTTIDEHLVSIISHYAPEEIRLHDEEQCYLRVKETNGMMDYATARAELMKKKMEQQNKKISLVEQMTGAVIRAEEKAPSKKKTAISFLHNYINKGYNTYITENRESFPKAITISVNDWTGQTTDGEDEASLQTQHSNFLAQRKNAEMTEIQKKRTTQTAFLIGAGVCAVLGIILAIAANVVVGVICFFGAIGCVGAFLSQKKKLDARVQETEARYQQMYAYGYNTIQNCVAEWKQVRGTVTAFHAAQSERITA
ncbi:MAG: hypothetical protein IK016_01410 [Lachnospiraceae bacterium]|nr:hypothetical protein [Lachnospiraceae bacterium]